MGSLSGAARPSRSSVRSHSIEAVWMETIEGRMLYAVSTTAVGVQFFSGMNNLNASDVAGVVPQANFNLVPAGNGMSFSGTTGPLIDGGGVVTSVTLSHAANDGGINPVDTSTPDGKLLGSEDKSVAMTTGTYTFNNVPAGTYTLIAYTQADSAAFAQISVGMSSYFINDRTTSFMGTPTFVRAQSTDAMNPDSGNYVRFDNVSPAGNGTLTLNNVAITGSAAINGLQLVPDSPLPGVITATLTGSILTVSGTNATDKIGLDLRKGRVRVAALSRGGVFESFDASTITGIVIDAAGATDKVDVDATLSINATLIGGSGNDVMLGGSGNDSLQGDSGRDRLIGRLGADVFSGGSGTNDTVEYGDRTRHQPITVSLDGVANDGGAGENDAVGTDIENVFGGLGNDTLIGNGSANILVGNRGADHLFGGDGADVLVAYYASTSADGAIDTLDGGTGTDTFVNDTLDQLLNAP
ncbi:MAG: regulatory domain of in-like proprotein convertase [Phycisphaerales bacterium]|nr:regulatory domain of in-like proprotein convertase [Phycisphaerales bacterium]